MGEHTMRVAVTAGPKAPAASRSGGEMDLGRILDRQHMPAGHRLARSITPTLDDFFGRHLATGEKPARAQFAAPPFTEPFEADGLVQQHVFEDRAPLLSRRASPNVPSEKFMAVPVFSDREATNRTCPASGKRFVI